MLPSAVTVAVASRACHVVNQFENDAGRVGHWPIARYINKELKLSSLLIYLAMQRPCFNFEAEFWD